MPRTPRIVIPGTPHHVTHRGNNKQTVFHSDFDRNLYLSLILKFSVKYELDILGYCLMTNHVHFIVLPKYKNSIAKGIGIAHNSYSRTSNRMKNNCGHLWQARFHSYPMDDQHLYNALKYVEQNPVRSKTVKRAVDYKWSSAIAHTSGVDKSQIVSMDWWNDKFNADEWHCALDKILDKNISKEIQHNVQFDQHISVTQNNSDQNTELETLPIKVR